MPSETPPSGRRPLSSFLSWAGGGIAPLIGLVAVGAFAWFATDGFGLNSPPDPNLSDQHYYDRDDTVDSYEPSEAEVRDLMRTSWSCFYDPTMNENWHDDVFCTDGVDSHRPILLEGQFVTEADMIAAGEAYEAELNASDPNRPRWMSDSDDACADGEDDWRDVLYECNPPG